MHFDRSNGFRDEVGVGSVTGRVNFGGECGALHCKQWGACGVAAPFQIDLRFIVI